MLRNAPWMDETDILYAISNRLTQAATPAEWLEAVSDYARVHGATSGLLLYLTMDESDPNLLDYAEITAVWSRDNTRTNPLGARFYRRDHAAFAAAWMAYPDRPLLVPDALNSEHVTGATRDLFAALGVRGMAVLPLNVKGRWVGELNFTWSEPFLFNESDHRIFTAIVQQAGPVIESMRLHEDSLQRAARAEQLLRINTALSQAVDEAEILAALAQYADQVPPDRLTLNYWSVDENGHPQDNSMVAIWQGGQVLGPDEELQDFPVEQYNIGKLLVKNPDQPLLIEDVQQDKRVDPDGLALFNQFGTRSLALLPLYSYGRWQGVFTTEWHKPHPFTEDERYIYSALMQTLPSVVASRRAYLAAETAREESQLLYAASKGINAARTFQEVVESLAQLNLQGISIVLWIWEGYDLNGAGYMELVAKTPDNRWPLHTRLSPDTVPMVQHFACNELVVIEDTRDREQMDEVTASTTEQEGYRALMAVTLCLRGRFMGLLGFESDAPRSFSPLEQRLAVGIGDLVTAAVERIRLREETERLAEQAQEMAALRERNRLARELHDSVSQALYGIALGARTAKALLLRDPSHLAEPLDYVLSLAEAGLSEMRALIYELRPELLENEGLSVALTSQAFSLEARYGVEVRPDLCDEPNLPIEIKEALYRIAREALHNVVKHAGAKAIDLRLRCEDRGVVLEVEDDGCGFDPDGTYPGHLGLQSMRERAAHVGAALELSSRPGEGTCIRVVVPDLACD